MIQSGFLYKLNPTDYILGASPIQWEEVMPTGDWRPFVPLEEKQSNLSFDTMSCTTFSALNVIEHWVNFMIQKNKLTTAQLEQLNKLGFIEKGKFNASDRFTAIMSGTTPQGNYFQGVLDSVRKDGLLPEKDFPFAGNSWNEYHDKSKITAEMKEKAKEILYILEFAYEWIPVNSYGTDLFEALKQSPVQVAVTKETPVHAVMLPQMEWEFDTYKPFLRKRNRTIAYAMKIKVTAKKPMQTYKYFSVDEVKKWKLTNELWLLLDKMREVAGTPFIITSGFRTPAENSAVNGKPNSAHLKGLAVDLLCTDNTKRSKILRGITTYETECFIEVAKKHLHIDIDSSIHTMGQTIVEDDE